jgi:hypothetical protein
VPHAGDKGIKLFIKILPPSQHSFGYAPEAMPVAPAARPPGAPPHMRISHEDLARGAGGGAVMSRFLSAWGCSLCNPKRRARCDEPVGAISTDNKSVMNRN